MHRQVRFSRNLHSIVMVLFALVVVISFAPAASAQMGIGGGGSGASGGGSKTGGSRGSRDQEKKPRPKRHEIPPVDPAAARDKLQNALTTALMRGTATTPYLANLFDQASTGAIPASVQSRKALAEVLSAGLKGKKLEEDSATAIAEPITLMINIDGIDPEELAAKKDPLKEALDAAGMDAEQVAAALAAADLVVVEQQNQTIKKIMDNLEEIQKDGEAGEDKKTTLAESITALADEQAPPDETSITKLSEQLVKAVDSAQLTQKEKAQLAWSIRAVFHSAGMPPAQFQPMLNEVRSTLKAGLARQADAQGAVNTLQSIHKSLSAGAPAAAPAGAGAAEGAGAAGEDGED